MVTTKTPTATAATSYEEKRNQRSEENKKRMNQLNLHQLYQALKPSPVAKLKRVKPKPDSGVGIAQLRKSTRTADKPPPNYYQFVVVGGRRMSLRRDLYNRVDASNENRMSAIERAKKLELCLGSEFPTFIRPLLYSHTLGGNLGFPAPFCKTHLPKYDGMLTPVDEDGNKCQTKFHFRYHRIGFGWKGFCTDHYLVDGDALVFQLIEPTTFKDLVEFGVIPELFSHYGTLDRVQDIYDHYSRPKTELEDSSPVNKSSVKKNPKFALILSKPDGSRRLGQARRSPKT